MGPYFAINGRGIYEKSPTELFIPLVPPGCATKRVLFSGATVYSLKRFIAKEKPALKFGWMPLMTPFQVWKEVCLGNRRREMRMNS
jgi:hypothetical protein